jgi:hypothetical protein
MTMRALVVITATSVVGCDTPHTLVVLDNDYPTTSMLVAYDAFWQSVRFPAPVPPAMSSDPQPALAASPNLAYVVLAPGWDPSSATPPTTFVVLESREGFALDFNSTLDIPLDDTTFAGNCAAGSTLMQPQADFITQRVFQATFAGLSYDAATCTATRAP